MTTVTDSELFANADRIKNKVVLITGAANGLGRSMALCFGRYGAKVVIGDLDLKGAEDVVAEIKSAGGDAVAKECDVTSWEQQLSLFQFAMSTFNRIDIVVPNAGVTEIGGFTAVRSRTVEGVPKKPKLKTIEVNLIGTLYTARLALFYLLENTTEGSNTLKALIFIGSMSSIEPLPLGSLYTTSKHSLIGLMGSLHGEYRDQIRIGIVCPWFADTTILSTPVKLFLAGIPLTPTARVGGSVFRAVTDPNPETNGAVWTLPDGGQLFRIDHANMRLDKGVYKLLNDRAEAGISMISKTHYRLAILKDLIRLLTPKIMPLAIGILAIALTWQNASTIWGYIAGRFY